MVNYISIKLLFQLAQLAELILNVYQLPGMLIQWLWLLYLEMGLRHWLDNELLLRNGVLQFGLLINHLCGFGGWGEFSFVVASLVEEPFLQFQQSLTINFIYTYCLCFSADFYF